MWKVKFDKRSFRQTRDNLDEWKDQIVRRAMKDALLKAATPGVKSARAAAPKESGALKKSIGKRGLTYNKTQTAFVKVGPKEQTSVQHGGQVRRPAKYAHLVEFGHKARDGSTVAPRPFMRTAFEGEKEQMKRIYAKEIGGAAMRHAARLNRRLKKRRSGGRRR